MHYTCTCIIHVYVLCTDIVISYDYSFNRISYNIENVIYVIHNILLCYHSLTVTILMSTITAQLTVM